MGNSNMSGIEKRDADDGQHDVYYVAVNQDRPSCQSP